MRDRVTQVHALSKMRPSWGSSLVSAGLAFLKLGPYDKYYSKPLIVSFALLTVLSVRPLKIVLVAIALGQKRDVFNRQHRRLPSQQSENSFGYGAGQSGEGYWQLDDAFGCDGAAYVACSSLRGCEVLALRQCLVTRAEP